MLQFRTQRYKKDIKEKTNNICRKILTTLIWLYYCEIIREWKCHKMKVPKVLDKKIKSSFYIAKMIKTDESFFLTFHFSNILIILLVYYAAMQTK